MALSSKRFAKPTKVLLLEPPNNLSVGFNATVVVEPLGLEYIAGAVSDIADVEIHDMRVDSSPLKQVIDEYKPDVIGV
ncbi:hypothetical protein M1O29_03500, partial [Dehalococcoidia bacterium]|nr:hypothetical protein [Dehalococcoidia bacterium]